MPPSRQPKLVIEPKRRPSWLPTLKEPGLTGLALAAGHGVSRKKAPVGVMQTEPGLKNPSDSRKGPLSDAQWFKGCWGGLLGDVVAG
jgi:hypothetical protein